MHLKFNFSKFLPKTHTKGSTPGTVKYVGEKREDPVKLQIIDYNLDELHECTIENLDEFKPYLEKNTVTWLNITGVHNTKTIEELGKIANLHPLVLEDIANTTQRPKVEDYENYLFIIIRMLDFDNEKREITTEQVSIIVSKNFVITFQEKEGDVLEPLRNRIKNAKGRIRKLRSDYLTYAIIDSMVDHYFFVLEQIGEELEKLEADVMTHLDQKTLNIIYRIKQELIILRKSIWPTRDMISRLERAEFEIIDDSIGVFFRDVYDHTIQVVETVETFRDMTSGLLDLYLSSVSNRMNEIMKVLTIFAAIFIPLTFIAGVYGMNFEYIPELKFKWGYFGVWIIMASVGLGLIFYFKRKKWF